MATTPVLSRRARRRRAGLLSACLAAVVAAFLLPLVGSGGHAGRPSPHGVAMPEGYSRTATVPAVTYVEGVPSPMPTRTVPKIWSDSPTCRAAMDDVRALMRAYPSYLGLTDANRGVSRFSSASYRFMDSCPQATVAAFSQQELQAWMHAAITPDQVPTPAPALS